MDKQICVKSTVDVCDLRSKLAFGKYKGRMLINIINDLEYIDWLKRENVLTFSERLNNLIYEKETTSVEQIEEKLDFSNENINFLICC